MFIGSSNSKFFTTMSMGKNNSFVAVCVFVCLVRSAREHLKIHTQRERAAMRAHARRERAAGERDRQTDRQTERESTSGIGRYKRAVPKDEGSETEPDTFHDIKHVAAFTKFMLTLGDFR